MRGNEWSPTKEVFTRMTESAGRNGGVTSETECREEWGDERNFLQQHGKCVEWEGKQTVATWLYALAHNEVIG